MQKKDIYTLVILVLILVVGAWLFSGQADEQNNTSLPPDDAGTLWGDSLVLERSFSEGVHTITGEITLPTPCYQFSYDAIVAESFPEQVTLNFKVEPPPVDLICIQMVATKEFSVEVSASEQATFSVRVNGQPIDVEVQKVSAKDAAEDTFGLTATDTTDIDLEVLQ